MIVIYMKNRWVGSLKTMFENNKKSRTQAFINIPKALALIVATI
jgi:hypothetical protein